MRLRLDLAYDGTDFSGWARQPGLRTVEGELATALGTVLRLPAPTLTVGGRTDAGVHARGATVHLEVPPESWHAVPGRSDRAPGEALVSRLRGVLPPDVVVRRAQVVGDSFDARFSALRRRYSYRLCDRPGSLDPLRRRDTVVWRRELDVAAMDRAAGRLTGLRDFAAFCRPRAGASTVRTLLTYRWQRGTGDGVPVATVVADAFCHSMVRALVGAVVPVGEGRREEAWPERVQATGVRDPSVRVMPAHGLCLEQVVYPAEAEEQRERARSSRAVRRL